MIRWPTPFITRLQAAVLYRTPARIRAARTVAGLTQRDMSALLGVTSQTVSNWENGRRTMPALKFSIFLELTRF